MSIKEENLIAYNGTLKKGQRLVKVGNSFMPVGVGGAFEPGSGSSSGLTECTTAKFYKCTSVDTANKTWSGYELILTDGVYTVSETLTEGLCYSAVTPVIGSVYSQDALIKVGMFYSGFPMEGLVFYAPLTKASTVAETGQILSHTGTLTYGVNDGLPSAYFDGSSYFSLPFTTNTDSLTESIWLKVDSNASYGYLIAFHQENSGRFSIVLQNDGVYFSAQDGNDSYAIKAQSIDSVTAWHHICVVRNGNVWAIYIDGIKSAEKTFSYSPASATRYYGRAVWTDYDRKNWHGWMAGIRSYNRALTQDEITALANEFTPTSA